MTADLLLTFNAGSSTVKIGFFEIAGGEARRVGKGTIDFRHKPLSFSLSEGPETVKATLAADPGEDLTAVLTEAFGTVAQHFDLSRIVAVGHRVVHGGDAFAGPCRIDDDTVAAIEALTRLAPLHQPQSLRLIRAIRQMRPDMAQSASFDTAFHRTNAEITRRFAIPRALHDEGIKRYGFHGLSYKFIAAEIARRRPDLGSGRIVAAHLGSGASLCGLEGGVSRDSSMGFSTLDGIPMATRCGALDPGVLLHLLGAGGRSLADVEDMLYHRSGLLGASGISADSRDLIASDRPEAAMAIDLFALRIAGEIGRLATVLRGLDGIVFTAGVGENQPVVRAKVAAHLAWAGLDLDMTANDANAATISAPGSRIAALVIATDEERIIADEALAVLHGKG